MNSKLKGITSSQVVTFIMSVQIGIGILTLPSMLAGMIGHDGWISALITGIAFVFASTLIIQLLKRYEDKSIFEINLLLYTKTIGFILNILLTAYLFFAAAIGLRLFTEIIDIIVLELTPGIIIAALLVIPSIHMVWHGLKTICRFDRIIILIVLTIILFLMLFLSKIRLTFLMPVGQAGFVNILNSMVTTSFAFIGIELVAVIYPNITDKKKLINSMIFTNIATALFYAILLFVLTGVFGENLLKRLLFPIFSLSRAYKAPVLERLDLFFISLWLPAMGISMTGYYYCAVDCLEKLIHTKKRFLLHIAFSIAVVLASRVPDDLSHTLQLADILSRLGIGVIVFLMFSLAFSYINTNGVMKK